MRLPEFIIVGAMKAGTSSLHRYLAQHPEVVASKRKELDFFNRHYDRGLTWYQRNFPGRSGVAGESSPNYLKAHIWPETAARIRAQVPKARLVCMLRDPVDRTLSHYLHSVWRGREHRPFSEAAAEGSNLVLTSRYGWQLDHYLAQFPVSQLLLVSTDELNRDPVGTSRKVLRFVGADDSYEVDTSERHNVTATNLATAGSEVPPDPALARDGDQIRLTDAAREQYAELFRPDLARLRLSWPDFPGW